MFFGIFPSLLQSHRSSGVIAISQFYDRHGVSKVGFNVKSKIFLMGWMGGGGYLVDIRRTLHLKRFWV